VAAYYTPGVKTKHRIACSPLITVLLFLLTLLVFYLTITVLGSAQL
jgi:hypothetical protein